MSFLDVNGIALPVLSTSDYSETTEEIRTAERTQSTTMTTNRRAQKRIGSGMLTFSEPDDSRWQEGLIQGLGQIWHFDDSAALSSGGVGPNSLTGLTIAATNPPPKYGASRLQVTSGNTFDVTLGYSEWTVLVWKNDTTNGANWQSFGTSNYGGSVIESDSGVTTTGEVSLWFSVASGIFTLSGKNLAGANAITRYDQLIIYPFALSQDALNDATAQDAALPDLPFVRVTGDCLRGRPARVCLGDVGSESYTQLWLGGTFYDNAVRIPFTLTER